jgi:hypothetical protein
MAFINGFLSHGTIVCTRLTFAVPEEVKKL